MASIFITIPYKSEMAIVDGVPCTVIEMPCEPIDGPVMANLIKAIKEAYPEMLDEDIDSTVELMDEKAAKRYLFSAMRKLVPGETDIRPCGDDESFELSNYFDGTRDKDSSLYNDEN